MQRRIWILSAAVLLGATAGATEEVETLRGLALHGGHPPLDVVVIRGTEVGGAVPEPRPAPPAVPTTREPLVQNVTILLAPAVSPPSSVVWGGYTHGLAHRSAHRSHRSVWSPPQSRSWMHRPGHHRGARNGLRVHATVGSARASHSQR